MKQYDEVVAALKAETKRARKQLVAQRTKRTETVERLRVLIAEMPPESFQRMAEIFRLFAVLPAGAMLDVLRAIGAFDEPEPVQ